MTREEIYKEIESAMGFVPEPFKCMTDQFIEQEWNMWKTMSMQKGMIPEKYKELISLGILSATQDKFGIFYRTQTAKMLGATDEEIREVAELAKEEVGWGPFLRLNQIDFEQFKEETMRAIQHFKTHREELVKASM